MEMTPAIHAAALWAGLSLVLLLVLSMRVVGLRRRHAVALGDGAVPELACAVRAFGNASEYIPAGLIGLGLLAVVGAPVLIVNLSGGLLVVGRILHAFGLSRSGEATLPRASGVALTWLAYILIAAPLLFYAVP